MSKSLGLFLLLFTLPSLLFSQSLKDVSLQLSWFDQFQFAGYYVAKEKGFYEEAGLDVKIIPYKPDIDVVSKVENNRANFGIGRESLFIEYSKNRPIVALYALFQSSPLAFITKSSSGIKTVQDFKNRRIMMSTSDSEEASLKAMLRSNGIFMSDFEVVEHSNDIASLINDEVDVFSAYLSKEPFELIENEILFKTFYPGEFGFDLYSDFLFTNREFATNNSETVQAFKQASLRGWRYAYENINESAKLIFDKYNSQNMSLEALIYEGRVLKFHSYQGGLF